jgi:hypothetical protein
MPGPGTVFILAHHLFLNGKFDCWTPDVFFRLFGNPEKNDNTRKDPEWRLEDQSIRSSSTRNTNKQQRAKHAM